MVPSLIWQELLFFDDLSPGSRFEHSITHLDVMYLARARKPWKPMRSLKAVSVLTAAARRPQQEDTTVESQEQPPRDSRVSFQSEEQDEEEDETDNANVPFPVPRGSTLKRIVVEFMIAHEDDVAQESRARTKQAQKISQGFVRTEHAVRALRHEMASKQATVNDTVRELGREMESRHEVVRREVTALQEQSKQTARGVHELQRMLKAFMSASAAAPPSPPPPTPPPLKQEDSVGEASLFGSIDEFIEADPLPIPDVTQFPAPPKSPSSKGIAKALIAEANATPPPKDDGFHVRLPKDDDKAKATPPSKGNGKAKATPPPKDNGNAKASPPRTPPSKDVAKAKATSPSEDVDAPPEDVEAVSSPKSSAGSPSSPSVMSAVAAPFNAAASIVNLTNTFQKGLAQQLAPPNDPRDSQKSWVVDREESFEASSPASSSASSPGGRSARQGQTTKQFTAEGATRRGQTTIKFMDDTKRAKVLPGTERIEL